MCGIAGIVNPAGVAVSVGDIKSISQQMYHRGPDDEGYLGWRRGSNVAPVLSRDPKQALADAEIAFLHRRLTIIDTSEGGWQPMGDDSGRYFISFNGEIYNYVELRSELQALGRSFISSSDTEVLLQAIAQWGIAETLPRLTGMFAFALLDVKENTLTLARDPFGIKPLSYTPLNGGLAFASELTSLLTLAGVSRNVEPSALYDYLRFGFTDRGERTLFSTIKHIPPAHFAVINLDNPDVVEPQCYWHAELKPILNITFDEAAAELRTMFLESVRLHLRSDVPVGAALSGGIDSSAVVGAMREISGSSLDLHTFTFIAPGVDVNEEAWADMAAKASNAKAHKVELSGAELIAALDDLIKTQGEPFGTTSIFAQNQVFKLARDNGIKVTLDGQGADEILGGYMPFLAARLATMIKKGQWIRAVKLLNSMDGKSGTLLRAMRFLLPTVLQGPARALIGEGLVPKWMNGAWFTRHGVHIQAPQKPVSGDVLRHELLESLTDRILPSLLRYEDRNSMAHSVESRVPFLTTKLVDFLYSLPEDFLISDRGETKSVFRAAMRGLTPDAILDRRDKIGFAAPEEMWLGQAGQWLDDVLSSDIITKIPAFDAAGIALEIEAVKAGKKRLTGDVWRWLNLVRWAEINEVIFD
jgi:asparagine synthase (glutamine-hydrolysing)